MSESEIRTAAGKLKDNKSSFSDKIKNEMIKSSLNELMPVYLKLFNTVLDLGTMPQMWCDGLITPIFKCGTKSDPSNYGGICISSCIRKLFCSILNQRLLKHVDLNNILHKSQIGFLANNRTADHVLTLRTLIDKYVYCHKEKIYACFVDFRKTFDSVWHDGLLFKLSKINVQGKFYSLIKSLYSKSTCSVRIGNNKTRSFQYARGVRRGCILSPLLFNLYLENYDFPCISLSDSIVNRYIGIMKNKYVSYWNQTLQQSQKLSFYCTIKDEYSPSPYLALTRKNSSRKALVRFRISSHQLRIETGRYEKIPRDERICYFCSGNKIEDENHFLLDCKAYSQIRDTFFSKLETKIPDFKSLSHDTLISLLINSSDYLINGQLVSFISQCFELRTKLISMNE